MSFLNNSLVPELSVTNFENSLDFYTRIIGFTIEYAREEDGFAFLRLGRAQLMLDQIGKGRDWQTGDYEYPLGRGINFEIEVENITPLIQNLEKNNIPMFLEPEEKWYRRNDVEVGNRQFLVQDPDGYLLRFTQDLGKRPIQHN